MQSYVIIFESTNKSQQFVGILKSLGSWGKITDNAWVVVTTKSAPEIRDRLLNVAGASDRIFVVKSGVLAAWSNVYANSDWIKANI